MVPGSARLTLAPCLCQTKKQHRYAKHTFATKNFSYYLLCRMQTVREQQLNFLERYIFYQKMSVERQPEPDFHGEAVSGPHPRPRLRTPTIFGQSIGMRHD